MATKKELKKAILDAVGNPEAGSLYNAIDTIVDAVIGLDTQVAEDPKPEVKEQRPTKETRVSEAPEIR